MLKNLTGVEEISEITTFEGLIIVGKLRKAETVKNILKSQREKDDFRIVLFLASDMSELSQSSDLKGEDFTDAQLIEWAKEDKRWLWFTLDKLKSEKYIERLLFNMPIGIAPCMTAVIIEDLNCFSNPNKLIALLSDFASCLADFCCVVTTERLDDFDPNLINSWEILKVG
jgi:hypothetical protein